MRTTPIYAISAVLLLAGCQSMQPPSPAAICDILQPITYSRNDTPETRAQIIEHNAVVAEICQ